jgi:hypothetical protein
MTSSAFPARVGQALLLLFAASSSFAETIALTASASNSVQIKALNSGGKTVYEIQLGGGNDQPPHDTVLTGKASVVIGDRTYSGYYSLATAPTAQLRMMNTAGAQPGKGDVYSFVSGYDVLAFKFAATDSFRNPWLTATISNLSATQQLPGQKGKGNGQAAKGQTGDGNNGDGQNGQAGDNHPPIVLAGALTAPMGPLAGSFTKGEVQLTLRVGGNQRLLELTPKNTHSGMSLESGTLTVRYDPKKQK